MSSRQIPVVALTLMSLCYAGSAAPASAEKLDAVNAIKQAAEKDKAKKNLGDLQGGLSPAAQNAAVREIVKKTLK